MFEKKLSKGRLNRIAVLVPCEDGQEFFLGRTLKLSPTFKIEFMEMLYFFCRLQGSGGFQPAGDAFPIDPVPQNIALLTCIC